MFGLIAVFELSCDKCNRSSLLYSSKETEKKDTPGKNLFGINIRTITAFGEMRKRPSGIQIFYGIQARNQEFFRREFCSN